jgi:hypothetical protein
MKGFHAFGKAHKTQGQQLQRKGTSKTSFSNRQDSDAEKAQSARRPQRQDACLDVQYNAGSEFGAERNLLLPDLQQLGPPAAPLQAPILCKACQDTSTVSFINGSWVMPGLVLRIYQCTRPGMMPAFSGHQDCQLDISTPGIPGCRNEVGSITSLTLHEFRHSICLCFPQFSKLLQSRGGK